ncbi:MAG TPA: TolC family protein, partial [Puia sp.]|nr:TolC family protein [Puia sp.]
YLMKWQIARLYLQIRKRELQLAIDSDNVNRYDSLYTVIRAITQSGIKAGADSALARAELSSARTSYNNTFGQIRQLYEELGYYTGIDPDKVAIDTSRIGQNWADRQSAGTGMLLAGAMDTGTAPNPLTDFYAKQQTFYEQTENLVKKSYLPRIMLTGVAWSRGSSISYQGKYGAVPDGWGYQRFNYQAGLTVTYNLFNPIHRRDKEEIARNESLSSQYELQQQQLELRNVGNKAEQSILTDVRNLREIPIQIGSAQAAFDQKTAQYRAGIINLVDLTNASYVLYRAQSDYVQAISDWLLANLDKAAAGGSLPLFIQSIQ